MKSECEEWVELKWDSFFVKKNKWDDKRRRKWNEMRMRDQMKWGREGTIIADNKNRDQMRSEEKSTREKNLIAREETETKNNRKPDSNWWDAKQMRAEGWGERTLSRKMNREMARTSECEKNWNRNWTERKHITSCYVQLLSAGERERGRGERGRTKRSIDLIFSSLMIGWLSHSHTAQCTESGDRESWDADTC